MSPQPDPDPAPPPPPAPAVRAVAVVLPNIAKAQVYVDDVTPPGGHTGTTND